MTQKTNDLLDRFMSGDVSLPEMKQLYGALNTELEELREKNPVAVRAAIVVNLLMTVRAGIAYVEEEQSKSINNRQSTMDK